MTGLRSLPINSILARGTITEGDVAQFRRVVFEDGIVSPEEAECLFKLNDAIGSKDPQWADFFVEALTDYLVFQERPHGYLTSANGAWLIERISRDGLVETKTELELLVNVLEKARWSPVSLVRFALEQVKTAVISGSGPLRKGMTVKAGTITDGEVDLLRRMLYGFGGDGSVAVTRNEADILFDIDEAVADATPNPVWTDLFVKAVANVIMSSSGYAVPTREEALRQEATLQSPEQQTSVLAFLLSMVQSNLSTIQDAYHDQTSEERALARLEHQRIEIITNETITEAEAGWLAARLGRDGRLSPSEIALVSYLKRQSPKIHPALVEAVERIGHAA